MNSGQPWTGRGKSRGRYSPATDLSNADTSAWVDVRPAITHNEVKIIGGAQAIAGQDAGGIGTQISALLSGPAASDSPTEFDLESPCLKKSSLNPARSN